MGPSDRLLLYFSLLVGAFLRFFRLGHQSIWGDEALTLQRYTVGSGIGELLSNIWHQGFHPPLFFVIAHYWYLLGDSEFMLRFPSAVFGVAAIPVMYLMTRRLFGPVTAGISALVLALSPFHIWYSQEARMYSLQVFLALGSMLFFLRAWESRRLVDFALYGIVTVLALFTHVGTLLLVAAQGLFVLLAVVRDRRRLAIWVGAQVLILLAFAPWIVQFVAARRAAMDIGGIGFAREVSLLQMGYGLYAFSVGFSLGPPVSTLHYLSPEQAVRLYFPWISLPALVFGTLVIAGLARAFKVDRKGFSFVLGHILVPLALAAAAAVICGVPLNPRYFAIAVVPYCMAAALGMQVCAAGRVLRLVPMAAVILMAFSLYNHYFTPAYAKQDVRSAVALINERAKPGDVIIISSVELGGPFIYYYERRDVPYVGYPPGDRLVDEGELRRDLGGILRRRKRAWLVLGRTWSSDPRGLMPATFRARYRLIEHRQYPGVTVSCFRTAS